MTNPVSNAGEYSVSELSAALKRTVEDAYGYVRVRGEISGFRGAHASGHCYFSLKDDKARLESVVWRFTVPKLKFRPQEGVEVIATGKLTTFAGQSKYQLVIETLEPAGEGALMALLEARRKALAAEGLFAEERKRPLPYLPRVIGVITSPTGAVIRDILHRLADRFPTQVIVWPVRVQGETSADEVAAAINGFNALPPDGPVSRPDLLIVARGGGSLEDLWSFNEEIVVRAAAASGIPLISAVGHETDTTLIDFAADRRAPTPTAAAEMAVPVRAELLAHTDALAARLSGGIARQLDSNSRELRALARVLPQPDDLLAMPRRTFDELAARIGLALLANTRAHRASFERVGGQLSFSQLQRSVERAGERLGTASERKAVYFMRLIERMRTRFDRTAAELSVGDLQQTIDRGREQLARHTERKTTFYARRVDQLRARLDAAGRMLDVVSYKSVLARGFALVSADGAPVRSATVIPPGKELQIEFSDGAISATANGAETSRPPIVSPSLAPAKPKRRKKPASEDPQGTLL